MRNDNRNLRTFEDVVRDYRESRQTCAAQCCAEWDIFVDPRQTPKDAILRACKSEIPKTRGIGFRRHSHQPRYAIPDEALLAAADCLQSLESEVMAAPDFATLFKLVRAAIGGIDRVGELAVYDIAHRIGAYRGLHPTEVYLHAGTRKGAKAIGLSPKLESVSVWDLPPSR